MSRGWLVSNAACVLVVLVVMLLMTDHSGSDWAVAGAICLGLITASAIKARR